MSGQAPPAGEPPVQPAPQPTSQQSYSPAPPPAPSGPPPWWMHPPKRRSFVRRVLRGTGVMIFLLSILLNVYLMMFLVAQMKAKFEKTVIHQGSEKQVIAVYTVSGVIHNKAASKFDQFCREVTDDKNVKAIVLRVNSPGGSVSASDRIHTLVKGLRQKGKKVVVSMGDVAASGGYYISAGADEIIAEPTTMTGSIGVIAQWVVLKGTLEKIGADMMILRSSNARGWKDTISLIQPPHDRQRKYLQEILDKMQERFEKIVKEGRGDKLPKEAIEDKMKKVEADVSVVQAGKKEKILEEPHDPFNGKVYLADRAQELGLIDDIGYQDKAIGRAGQLAGLTNPRVVQYRARRGLLQKLMGELDISTGLQVNQELLDSIQTPRIMMLWKAE